MPVHPQIKALLDEIATRRPKPLHECEPAEGRENMLKSRALFTKGTVELPRVENLSATGPAGPIPLRLYSPKPAGGPLLPLLVYYHGGGWVIGDLDTHDDVARRLAKESGCMVVAVDYRLAPEHKFPAAADDAWAALTWLSAHAEQLGADAGRLAVAGDSAGGNLSAVVAQRARDEGHPAIALQILIYPAVSDNWTRPSYEAHGEGYLLTFKGMQWFWNHYLNDPAEIQDTRATPLNARSLAGLPPALVLLAEIDILVDEGVIYAERLRAEGVPVEVKVYPGAVHGFLGMTVTEPARQAIADAAAALRETLRP